MGRAGRVKAVALHSLDTMVDGYQNLIDEIYDRKAQRRAPRVRRPGKAAVGR